jgi:NADPH:quinone reductase-like Zn-dependent oxidoreductase
MSLVSASHLNRNTEGCKRLACGRQVLVRIHSCGVCHTDVHTVEGDWPIKSKMPLIPGHEGAGVVVKTGPRVAHIKVGYLSLKGPLSVLSLKPHIPLSERGLHTLMWGLSSRWATVWASRGCIRRVDHASIAFR